MVPFLLNSKSHAAYRGRQGMVFDIVLLYQSAEVSVLNITTLYAQAFQAFENTLLYIKVREYFFAIKTF